MLRMWIFIGKVIDINNGHINFTRTNLNLSLLFPAASIVLLVFAIFCSLGISLSLQKIIGAFEERCVLFAELEFEPILTESSEVAPIRTSNKFANLSHFFNESYANYLDGDSSELPVDQVEFMMRSECSKFKYMKILIRKKISM